MHLLPSSLISEVDRYAENTLGISQIELMKRSAEGVLGVIKSKLPRGGKVVILAGPGNNGGDGYALAKLLSGSYIPKVFDVLGKGQRSEAGKFYLDTCIESGIAVEEYSGDTRQREEITKADCIVDAVFGTGVRGELPEKIIGLCDAIGQAKGSFKIAVDVPLGVNPDTGEALPCTPRFDATVELSFPKVGVVSYPAKEYTGELFYCNIGLPTKKIAEIFPSGFTLTDRAWAKDVLPERPRNSNKGSFGKLLIIAGSEGYPGAPILSVEAALRGGVGYVCFLGEEWQNREMLFHFPEVIYKKRAAFEALTDADIKEAVALAQNYTAVLIGPGAGRSVGLASLVRAFIESSGAPLVLDADAVSSLSRQPLGAEALLANAKRNVIITPHPGEFATITGKRIAEIQGRRIPEARSFAEKTGVTLVLKGAGTLIADRGSLYINSTGSPALSKAGSGDCLAGLIAALVASGMPSIQASALGVYIHGAAGDSLEGELSSLGVTPSDLPLRMARIIAELEKEKKM